MTWVDIVKQAMQQKGINQKQLSELSGITESSVCRYLKGDRKPRIDILTNFARVLELPLTDLLDTTSNSTAFADLSLMISRRGEELTEDEVNKLVSMLRGEGENV